MRFLRTGACGSFGCAKTTLTVLNVLFICISAMLIGLTAYLRAVAIVTSIGVISGMLACGVVLLLLSALGLAGARLHNQAVLFFYTLLLCLVCLGQLTVSLACLAAAPSQQSALFEAAWRRSSDSFRSDIQLMLDCCGFEDPGLGQGDPLGHPPCLGLGCCVQSDAVCCHGNASAPLTWSCPCRLTCLEAAKQKFSLAVRTSGGVGIVVALTEVAAVWMAIRYRNLRDPDEASTSFI